jgi:6-phosphogluconolactonase
MIEHVVVFNDEAELWQTCAELITQQVGWVSGTGRRAGMFVAGGSTYLPLYAQLGDFQADIFPTDERMVPPGTSFDTGAMLQREWIDRLVHPELCLAQVQRLGDAPSTAVTYEQQLREWQSKGGIWGVALLGVGNDGHTASLFPGQRNMWEGTQSWVIPAEAEQEPFVPRVSGSPALFGLVPRHIIVLAGSGKTDIARKWLREREKLPVEYVQPSEERYVLLDRIAARDLDPKQYDLR